ncbi:helicase HerA-like C-terminal domain-containing protein [Microvirga sp. W0021]|uniref:Helicase HerA-like C-terminal domain-containing protein n=1 Tax=Hohaiivirga grylli TaxID=3133970 RepID=A0ABV0BHF2_9HYPH
MVDENSILIGKSQDAFEKILLKYANRHGLIAGATGTGKTVTLQVLAEGFSNAGVPVFAADIKGDLSGIAANGEAKAPFVKRAEEIGIEYVPDRFPTVFWDIFGEQGHPVRSTVTEMGPILLSRMLELNDTQEGVLNIAFKVADDNGLPLLDMKDLRSILNFLVEQAAEVKEKYGNVTKDSVATILRRLLVLENQGAEHFFGEPALNINDFMHVDRDGRGVVNILAADKLMTKPRLYASFLLWMLSSLFEALPEVGDPEKPKLVFFFDEAHLLFNDAPKALLTSIEQVVRLIRSKGVGVYFVTQNPVDIPETVLAQLGNRVQHALRAFTPRDQKAVRAAAETFRKNPEFSTEQAITQLAVGEALVSTLDDKGTPTVVQRTLIAPPSGRVGPLTDAERAALIKSSGLMGRYEEAFDRESAYEMLIERAELAAQEQDSENSGGGITGWLGSILGINLGGGTPAKRGPGRPRMTVSETVIRSTTTSVANSVGREIGKVLTGSTSTRKGASITDKAIQSATSSAVRAIVRNILGGLTKK